jgi:hypothetical protein
VGKLRSDNVRRVSDGRREFRPASRGTVNTDDWYTSNFDLGQPVQECHGRDCDDVW